jgi:uncharacterized protein YndB with AHSA1/START domain
MSGDDKKVSVTTPSDREFRIERIFEAPRDIVFAVYTDPATIPDWWGGPDDQTTVTEMDVRPGGGFRYVIRGADGGENAFRGTYREVTPPSRLVQSFEWEGMPGHVSIETVTFDDLGDRTRVTTVSLFHTTEERDMWLEGGMESALTELYSRLDAVLARRL